MPTYFNITRIVEQNFKNGTKWDLEKLEEKVDAVINELNEEDYKVLSITPLTASKYDDSENRSYGISYTVGVLIVFERIQDDN